MIALLLQSNIPSTAHQPGAPVEKGWAEKAGKKSLGSRQRKGFAPRGVSRQPAPGQQELGFAEVGAGLEVERTQSNSRLLAHLLHHLAQFHLTPFYSQPCPSSSPWGMRYAKQNIPTKGSCKERNSPSPPKMRLPALNNILTTLKHPGLSIQVHPSPIWFLSPSMQKLILTKPGLFLDPLKHRQFCQLFFLGPSEERTLRKN